MEATDINYGKSFDELLENTSMETKNIDIPIRRNHRFHNPDNDNNDIINNAALNNESMITRDRQSPRVDTLLDPIVVNPTPKINNIDLLNRLNDINDHSSDSKNYKYDNQLLLGKFNTDSINDKRNAMNNDDNNNDSNTNSNTNDNNNNNNKESHNFINHSHKNYKQFYRTSLGDWVFKETVGAGSMGKVKLAKNKYTNNVCAIKIVNRATKSFIRKQQQIKRDQLSSLEILKREKQLQKEISRDKRTIREASLGKIMYHDNICKLLEICTLSNHFYMLFEYIDGIQLLDYIIQHGSLSEKNACKIARNIASAIQYLHANNIVHRDLKIENIMIDKFGNIKLIDFGLSNFFNPQRRLTTYCGSLYFAAPELLRAQPYIGPEIDIWSFGVIIYVLVCGKVPFDDENSNALHEKIKRGKVKYPNFLSIDCIALLSRMLTVKSQNRATLQEVVNHYWMVKDYHMLPPRSFLPDRIPLTAMVLDNNVLKELYCLELIDDIQETRKKMVEIISTEKYKELTRKHFELKQQDQYSEFSDPLIGYHPLISLYYLCNEWLQRRKFEKEKNEKKSLITSSKSDSNTLANVINNSTDIPIDINDQKIQIESEPIFVDEVETKDLSLRRVSDIKDLKNIPNKRSSNGNNDKEVDNNYDTQNETLSNNGQNKVSAANVKNHLKSFEFKEKDTNENAVKGKDKGNLLNEILNPIDHGSLILPNLKKKRSTHLSPTRKNHYDQSHNDVNTNNLDMKTQKKISNLLRRFSLRTSMTTTTTATDKTNVTVNNSTENNTDYNNNYKSGYTNKNDNNNVDFINKHKRTVSESHNHRKPNVRRLNTAFNNNSPTKKKNSNLPNNINFDNNPIASSPSSSNSSEYSGNKRSRSAIRLEISENEIMKQAQLAPMGSMPSIDYPKIMFLKGFFSVQTTSSKPLPVVRYKIIKTLQNLNINFNEVKGGFVCVYEKNTFSHKYRSKNENTNSSTIGNRKKYDSDKDSNKSIKSVKLENNDTYNIASIFGSSTTDKNSQYKKDSSNYVITSTPSNINANVDQIEMISENSQISPLTNNESNTSISRANDSHSIKMIEKTIVKFEIHIVKVKIISLAGIHFKKISGNTWVYKEIASKVLHDLKF